MNFDDLKFAWKCQEKSEYSNLNPEELLKHLQLMQKRQGLAFLVVDIFVATVLISCTAYFISSSNNLEVVWPLYLGSILILGAAVFHPWRNHRRRKRERRFGNSLRDELQKRSEQLDEQIRFSRWSSIWGYYLPIICGLCLLYAQFYLNDQMLLDQFYKMTLFHIGLLGFLGYFAGGLGSTAARKEKEEVDRELTTLGFPVTNESIPRNHQVARMILILFAAFLSAYLLFSILNPKTPDNSPVKPTALVPEKHFAKVAPYWRCTRIVRMSAAALAKTARTTTMTWPGGKSK